MIKSREQKTPIINVSKTRMAMRNSLTRIFTLLMQDRTQIGVMKAVKTINKIEIPSTPNLNLIKPLIHSDSSTN